MPITSELQQVGFSEAQAQKLAELFERSIGQGFDAFSEKLDLEIERLRADLIGAIRLAGSRTETRIEAMGNRLSSAQNALLLKLFGMFVGVISLAVAIIKLFPNVG